MNNSLFDFDIQNSNKKYENLKLENDRLLSQNSKLLKQLEEVTLQFSKSQTKIKEIELKESSQTYINGNLNILLEQTKLLEADNIRLCKELKKQVELNKLNNEANLSNEAQMCDKISLQTYSKEKTTNLKNHIRELQKQLVKTQKIACENECNYKVCQIETLEALKYCEEEKFSLGNKISSLEESASNMLTIHLQNIKLKTSLNQSKEEIQSLQDQQRHLADSLRTSEQNKNKLQEEIKVLEDSLRSFQVKTNDVASENQCLLMTLEQLTSSLNIGPSDGAKNEDCELCKQKASLLVNVQNEMEKLEINLNEAEREKENLNTQYQEQLKIIHQFEGNQQQLRNDLNNLTASSSKYDSLLKSKNDELESMTCQLSSVEQLLELRDQRINELSNQLNKSVSEEKNHTLKISQLLEKSKINEKDAKTYQQRLTQSIKEKDNLSVEMEQYKSLSEKNNKVIYDLKSQLHQNDTLINELKTCLDNAKSTLITTTQEFSSKIVFLNKKIDELNYSVKVFGDEVLKLEESLQIANKEIEGLRKEEKRKTDEHQLVIDAVQLELQNKSDIINDYICDIKARDLEIEEIKKTKINLEIIISKTEEEMKSCMSHLDLSKEKIKEYHGNLIEISTENNQLKEDLHLFQQLKLDMAEKMKEFKRLKHKLSEVNITLDILQKSFSDEKDKNIDLEAKYKDVCSQIETLQFKFSYIEEELDRKRIYIQELEANQRSEIKYNCDKLQVVEKERNDLFAKICLIEGIKDKTEQDCNSYKNKSEEMEKVVIILREELLLYKNLIEKLENDKSVLKDHVKCGQVALVERSRDVDRLEQLVRDRTEQIEVRSKQLQEFEVDLTERLKELELQVFAYKSHENINLIESNKLREYNREILSKSDIQEKQLKEINLQFENVEKQKNELLKRENQLTSENQSLMRDSEILKKELTSKTNQVKDLLQQIRNNDREIKNISEMLEFNISDVTAKNVQIKKINEQLRQSRKSFTEAEIKFKNEVSSINRKLELVQRNAMKENGKIKKFCESECEKYEEELRVKCRSIERMVEERDNMLERLSQREEELAQLRDDLQREEALWKDTENKCRVKEVVIERLMKKLTMESVSRISASATKEDGSLSESYEDESLRDVINRVTAQLEHTSSGTVHD